MPETGETCFLRNSGKWKLRRGRAGEDHREERFGREEEQISSLSWVKKSLYWFGHNYKNTTVHSKIAKNVNKS